MTPRMHIIGFRAPDERWKKMKAVWDACTAIDVDIPPEVRAFFVKGPPSEDGVEIDLEGCGAVQKYRGEYKEGFVVNLELLNSLVPNLTHIRFYNSY